MGSIVSLLSNEQVRQAEQGMTEVGIDIANQQAAFAEQRATDIGEAGAIQLHQQRLQQQSLLAQAQVAGAGAGVQVGTGSLLDFEVSATEVFDQDRSQLQFDIENRQYEARIGAWNARNQAEALRSKRANQDIQRAFGLFGDIAGVAGEGGKIAATVAGGAFGGVQGAVAGFQAGSMFSKFLGGK